MTAARTPQERVPGFVYELDLPWTAPPLSLNHRNNWRVHAKKAAEIRQASAALAKQAKLGGPWAQIRVALHYVPRDKRVRDAENPVPTLKAICDGLVDAGVVSDDDPGHMVKEMPVIHDPSGLKPRLWLVIEFLAAETTTSPDPAEDFSQSCRIEGCPCRIPGPVCEEFMGCDGERWCPRCGWSERVHATEVAS